MLLMKIAHHVPDGSVARMEAARTKAKNHPNKGSKQHYTIPMCLCAHNNQSPLSLVSYTEYQMLHAGLSAVQLFVEAAGDSAADIPRVPLGRRRASTIQAIGASALGRGAIASAIGAFYTFTGAGAFGGGSVASAFYIVTPPFISHQTSCLP